MLDGTDATLAKAEWAHNGAGQRMTASLFNGVTSTFGYDVNGRLSAITHTAHPTGGAPVDVFLALAAIR
jgi:YD repeat-containing protein